MYPHTITTSTDNSLALKELSILLTTYPEPRVTERITQLREQIDQWRRRTSQALFDDES